MKEIKLIRNKVTTVDDEDYEYLNKFKWSMYYRDGKYRAIRSTDGCPISRLIMKCPSNLTVDHIDGNTLDNRKSNLRICTHAENCRNKDGWKTKPSKYKGVYKISSIKWVAKIGINGTVKHLGTFKNEKTAALAYNSAAAQMFGEFARLNIIDE